MSNYILHINSTTSICSVAVSDGEKLLSIKETHEANSHTEVITLFIKEVMTISAIDYKDLSAVALAAGPGSYTSLRVGCATAKGICFAHNIPLIAIPSLDILAHSVIDYARGGDYIIPMIDARRMEVYTAVYNYEGKKIVNDHAHIISEESFTEYIGTDNTHHFVGNGAKKTQEILIQKNKSVYQNYSSAKHMLKLATELLNKKAFVDTAYYEPYYLKGANVTKSKKKYF